MDLSEDLIIPYNEQIVMFVGQHIDTTRGYVDLRMCLSTDQDVKELRVRYLLVKVDTSYNVLMGRPCLKCIWGDRFDTLVNNEISL